MTLKPWREIIVPHEDVLEGTFEEASFAADLTKVIQGVAPPEYQDPIRFFERTVITEGMSLLLQSVVKRLSGKGGDPVVQLQTAFGGGKTHTMMAVMHVVSGKASPKDMLGVPEILAKAKIKKLESARVAVLDGNLLSPSHPRKHGKTKANTLWGELAFQIGGAEAYERVEASDKDGVSPGKQVLAELFRDYGPVIVLMDETVAYLRQFEKGKSYPGGTYNSVLSFFQAITEATSSVPNAMLLASLPESKLEVGDEHGEQVLEALQKLFGRIEAVWKPVGREEAYEIVRRRLFGQVQNEKARAEACRAFADLYTNDPGKFPADAREGAYLRRLEASYPIHPEVFERLYEDWSTLPKFQRTRGVLRLMARLVHALWRADNRDFLILPGSIPLDDISVRNELVKYLPAGWDPIVDKDIDGNLAEPRRMDDETPTLGSMQANRRAARTIFLGSAPSVGVQKVRGIGVERVRLGCAQPGQSVGRYDDALRRLSERLHYLYSGNDRFWFDLRPNLRREMEDRMHRFDTKLHVYAEVQERLQKLVKCSLFTGVHVFAESKEVPDKGDLRLVVLDPDQGHKRKDMSSAAVKAAEAILVKHGDKPREYGNRLLFLAAEGAATPTLRDLVRRYLAWQSIVDDADELNLDKHHEKDANKNRDDAEKRIEGSLRDTYKYLLAPMQEADDGGVTQVSWEDETLQLSNTPYDKAIERATHDKEWVISGIKGWAPKHLHDLLAKWFWKDDRPSVSVRKVWLDLCKYLYMPRLASSDVFVATIKDGIRHKDFFGYAGSEKSPGVYQGLLFGTTGGVYLDDTSLLVRPDAATIASAPRPVEVPDDAALHDQRTGYAEGEESQVAPSSSQVPARAATQSFRRFHGTVDIAPSDPISSFSEIVQNVVEQFTMQYGTSVTISIDIEARRSDKFDLKTVRIVRENAATLKFKTAEFEES